MILLILVLYISSRWGEKMMTLSITLYFNHRRAYLCKYLSWMYTLLKRASPVHRHGLVGRMQRTGIVTKNSSLFFC